MSGDDGGRAVMRNAGLLRSANCSKPQAAGWRSTDRGATETACRKQRAASRTPPESLEPREACHCLTGFQSSPLPSLPPGFCLPPSTAIEPRRRMLATPDLRRISDSLSHAPESSHENLSNQAPREVIECGVIVTIFPLRPRQTHGLRAITS